MPGGGGGGGGEEVKFVCGLGGSLSGRGGGVEFASGLGGSLSGKGGGGALFGRGGGAFADRPASWSRTLSSYSTILFFPFLSLCAGGLLMGGSWGFSGTFRGKAGKGQSDLGGRGGRSRSLGGRGKGGRLSMSSLGGRGGSSLFGPQRGTWDTGVSLFFGGSSFLGRGGGALFRVSPFGGSGGVSPRLRFLDLFVSGTKVDPPGGAGSG